MLRIDADKLKKNIAYTDDNDLLNTLENAIYYLEHHNKNLTHQQENMRDLLATFVDSLYSDGFN